MNKLLSILEGLIEQYKSLIRDKNAPTQAGNVLYKTALSFIGKDASPLDSAPDPLACAESVNEIVKAAFGEPAGGNNSTYWLYIALKNHRKFVEVTTPLPGDIIISPTGIGGGKNGVSNGHAGIMLENNQIASNDSRDGVFRQNYALFEWKYRYQTIGGYKVYFFRRVI